MESVNKKNKPANYLDQERVSGKPKKKKGDVTENIPEIREVNDKLIGDDLDIIKAKQGGSGNSAARSTQVDSIY